MIPAKGLYVTPELFGPPEGRARGSVLNNSPSMNQNSYENPVELLDSDVPRDGIVRKGAFG
ncbi:MAG: hypothetical protein IIC50_06125 [Planctomycetes bacterium]|nr:hypothetical protein [Planctomycetota bacterium]